MSSMKGKIDEYNKSLTAEERKENARRSGQQSGVVRIQKKLIRDALSDFLNVPVKSVPMAREVANMYGIKDDMNIKALYIVACVLNTMKSGTIKDIIALCDLLNEKTKDNSKLDELINALRDIQP